MREIIIKYSRDIVLAGAVTTGIVRGALVMMRVDVVVSSTLGRPDSWQMELSSLLSISTILNQSMRKSSILVINVTIKLHKRET